MIQKLRRRLTALVIVSRDLLSRRRRNRAALPPKGGEAA